MRWILGNTVKPLFLADSASPRKQHTAQLRGITARCRFAHHSRERHASRELEAETPQRPATPTVASFGGKMNRTSGIFFAVVMIAAAVPSAKAGGAVSIKCAPNEDRVWVYESLTDFNVAAKLKCGDPVQIVERVKGYVKIETANGTEGYVLDTSFPKSVLPPEPVEKPNDVESASLAVVARRASRPASNSVDAPASAHSSAPAVVASVAPTAVVKPVAPSEPPPQSAVTLSSAAVSPAAVAPARVAAAPPPAPPTVAVTATNSNSATNTNTAVVAENIAPAAPEKATYRASEPTKAPQPAPAATPQPTPVRAAAVTIPRATPVVAVSAPAPAVVTPTKAPAVVPVSNPAPVAAVSRASVSAPSPHDSSNASSMTIETSATLQPVADAAPRAPVSVSKPPAKRPADPDGDEDSEVAALNSEEANCTQYFSAYGLSANQYKWLAQNRRKGFPGGGPAQVDFVVIFTHDVPFYNVTMPNAVHTDLNGFSDWTPLTTVDTAVISATDADKSHHEYVWVFHTNRGAFNPTTFSSRRRPLYSKAETNMLGSRGGFRTVMDALTFIEQNGTNR